MSDRIDDDECRDIDVSCDWTWLTRGHSSKICSVSVIDYSTGKVPDALTKPKVCKSCEYRDLDRSDKDSDKCKEWRATRYAHCTNIHGGSAGSWEKEIIKDVVHILVKLMPMPSKLSMMLKLMNLILK